MQLWQSKPKANQTVFSETIINDAYIVIFEVGHTSDYGQFEHE